MVLLLVFIVPAGLIQLPPIQTKIASEISNAFEKKIGTKVDIGHIDLGFFNQLMLNDVYIEDQKGNTLLSAKRLGVKYSISSLLKKKLHFYSAQLYTFDIYLNKETLDSELNIQYIIDAFAPDPKKETKTIAMRINSIQLNRGSLSYDVDDQMRLNHQFDKNHIQIKDLCGKLNFESLKDKQINATLKRLKFKEQSGFTVKNLVLDLAANPDSILVNHLFLELPKSKLDIENISIGFTSLQKKEDSYNLPDLDLTINKSSITLSDLAAFYSDLSKPEMDNTIRLEGKISGNQEGLNIPKLSLLDKYGSHFYANLSLNERGKRNNLIFIDGNINDIYLSQETLFRMNLPEEVQRLESILFKGKILGFIDNIDAEGDVTTGLGKVLIDLSLHKADIFSLTGNISTEDWELGRLLANDELGKTTFNIDINSEFNNKLFSGSVDADIASIEYKKHSYNDIAINASFSNNNYEGQLIFDSDEGKLNLEGALSFNGAKSKIKLKAKGQDLLPDKLNISQMYEHPVLSFNADIELDGNNLDNITGKISLDNVSFSADKESFNLNSFSLNIDEREEDKILSISSDILDMELSGNFHTSTIISQIGSTIENYLPNIIPFNSPESYIHDNKFSFHLSVGDLKNLSSLLKLPFDVSKDTEINGFFDYSSENIFLSGFIPYFNVGNIYVDSCNIELDNIGDALQLNIDAINLQRNYDLGINADISAKDNIISSQISWKSSTKQKYDGSLDFISELDFRNHSEKKADIFINESLMHFNDSLWTLYPTKIDILDKKITINKLLAKHKEQSIYINGSISPDPDDLITANLNVLNLEYIFNALDIPALEFGGIASGIVTANDVYKTKELNTNLKIKDFTFNQSYFGDLDLRGSWIDEQQGVHLLGDVYKNENSSVKIDGMLYPVKGELSILFDAKDVNVDFTRKWLQKTAKDVSGEATGKIRLFGNWNDPTLEGEAFIKDGSFGIDYLNTRYYFSDMVKFEPDQIYVENLVLLDEYGNRAQATASVKHNLLQDFKFIVDANFQNFLAFNATPKTNPTFYGKVFASGNLSIYGNEEDIHIDINAQNNDNSKISLNFLDKIDIQENNFIVFVSEKDTLKQEETISLETIKHRPRKKAKKNSTQKKNSELNVKLTLNVNPSATIETIIDPIKEDMITTNGNGNIELHYGTNDPLLIYGSYEVEKGNFEFSLEQLYFLDFKLGRGSKITFQGDPNKALLDLNAAQRVQANLSDLDPKLMEMQLSTKSKVPVDCIILLGGALDNPEINFDIQLPNASSALESQVKSYIRTDEMLTRQFLYLLALNTFYTAPEYSQGESRNDYSLLTSALSNQLNNLLGSLSDNVQIGTQFHQSNNGDMSSTEVELLFSTSFGSRWVIYGNFGYVDNPYVNSEIPVVGDFDVEYKLTKSGDIRLHAFNHYNYRYFNEKAKLTQGIGIIFRRDFNHIYDFLKLKKEEREAPLK